MYKILKNYEKYVTLLKVKHIFVTFFTYTVFKDADIDDKNQGGQS